MKAIRIHEFEGPEGMVLEDIPVPAIKPGEVLVKVYASSVNPVDWKIMEGARQGKFPVSFPLTPGWDVSGVIEQVGEKVSHLKPGMEVYGRPDPTRNGAFAEYLAVRASELAEKPATIGHTEAAAIPLAGLTAWQGLFEHGLLQKGQRVLIHAASGGVGTFAVQFAKWKGAYVIATTSEAHIPLVKKLGADEIIDYEKEDFSTAVKELDLVFDTLGGAVQLRSLAVLKKGGRLITTLAPEAAEEARKQGILLQGYMASSHAKDLEEIAVLVEEGKVSPVIHKIMSLEEAAQAEKESREGHVGGKIVIVVR